MDERIAYLHLMSILRTAATNLRAQIDLNRIPNNSRTIVQARMQPLIYNETSEPHSEPVPAVVIERGTKVVVVQAETQT